MGVRYTVCMDHTKRDAIFVGVAILVILVLLGWFLLARIHPKLPTAATSTSLTASSTPLAGNITDTKAPATKLTDHGKYYDIDLKYPSATPLSKTAGASADASAVSAMKVFSQNTAESFREDGDFASMTPQDIQIQGLGPDRKYTLSDDYTYYSSPSTISYVFTLYEDTLGAHPNGFFRTFTFDGKTGTGLELSDLFTPGANYLNTLSTISRKMLNSQLGDMADPDMVNAGTTADADNFQDFALDGKNLVLIFPPYQVAAYAAGPQTIKIPLSQLKDILKSEYQ